MCPQLSMVYLIYYTTSCQVVAGLQPSCQGEAQTNPC